METIEEFFRKILLPFREEARQGFTNRTVIGGFDAYVSSWAARAMSSFPKDPALKKTLGMVIKAAARYGAAPPAGRKGIMKEIYFLLKPGAGGLKEEPAKPAPLPVDGEMKSRVARKLTREGVPASLADPVTRVPGVGPRTGAILQNAGIATVEDLLFHVPREYQDRREIKALCRVEAGKFQVMKGRLGRVMTRSLGRGKSITKSAIMDASGSVSLVWFNQPFAVRSLKEGAEYIVSGRVEYKFGSLQVASPDMEELDSSGDAPLPGITPIYPLTEGISQKFMRRVAGAALQKYLPLVEECLPPEIPERLGMPSFPAAVRAAHHPESPGEAEKAMERLRFEEAFFMQLRIAQRRRSLQEEKKSRSYIPLPPLQQEFENGLPFRLTPSQRKAIEEIRRDFESPHPMNRLLQGDVGSGKTIVCAFFVLAAARSGYQAAIMAPTEVLAEQHFYNFRQILGSYGVDCSLLVGATPPDQKEKVKCRLRDGSLPVVVGTHALIQEDVSFHHLAFAVVDEQHKFGVMQRATLKEKGQSTDFLFTTATPIPRSLCLTLYGDLDASVIDELPPGRQPIKTMWIPPAEMERVYRFMEGEIEKGGRAYVVCPIIDESEKVEGTPLLTQYQVICSRFPGVGVGLLHGRMKGTAKEEAMRDFASGKYAILVSTTVIEVGVDVPDAALMVILDANRYGLGQLHQLRGRVGRGQRKSYCIMVAGRKGAEAGQRLRVLMESQSGFEIAEADMRLRGPGDIAGFQQSGMPPLRFLDMSRDYGVILKARDEAFRIDREDPRLLQKDHGKIKEKLQSGYKNTWDIIH
jgi:ATP-dependent DNA helicase RecG